MAGEFANVEVELIALLSARLTGAVVASELDNDLLDDLPLVQVTRVAGDDDGVRLDRALVDVDVYAATRAAASLMSEQVRAYLLGELRGTVTAAAVFGLVRTVSAPSWRPYQDTNLRRFGATYEIYLRPAA